MRKEYIRSPLTSEEEYFERQNRDAMARIASRHSPPGNVVYREEIWTRQGRIEVTSSDSQNVHPRVKVALNFMSD